MILTYLFAAAGALSALFGVIIVIANKGDSIGLVAALPFVLAALVLFGLAQLINLLDRIARASEQTARASEQTARILQGKLSGK